MTLDLSAGRIILVKNGHTSQEALDLAMQRIDLRLEQLVPNGRLTDIQRQDWSSGIRDLLEKAFNISSF